MMRFALLADFLLEYNEKQIGVNSLRIDVFTFLPDYIGLDFKMLLIPVSGSQQMSVTKMHVLRRGDISF